MKNTHIEYITRPKRYERTYNSGISEANKLDDITSLLEWLANNITIIGNIFQTVSTMYVAKNAKAEDANAE